MRMTIPKWLVASVGLFLLPASLCASEAGRFGIGGVLGDPTGFALKYWFTDRVAMDGVLGWRFNERPNDYYCDDYDRHRYGDACIERRTRLDIHSDVLLHFDPFPVHQGRLPLSIGLGLRILSPDTEVGLRIPFGISYLFRNVPIDLFAEIAPVIVMAPYGGSDLDGGVGIRFYFSP